MISIAFTINLFTQPSRMHYLTLFKAVLFFYKNRLHLFTIIYESLKYSVQELSHKDLFITEKLE